MSSATLDISFTHMYLCHQAE